MPPSIYAYIKEEESKFETQEIQVGDNWNWSLRNHVQLIFHLKNGVFYTGNNDYMRAFKNIMQPILDLAYWMEDIEVKDIVFYIEEKADRFLSFLIKKYHDEVYVRENDLDSLIDQITECDLDYGGVLVQKTNDPKPEILKFIRLAFCDQNDMLGGPIAFKFSFSPSKLRAMSKLGWGNKSKGADTSIEDLITLASQQKQTNTLANNTNVTTGKNIDVYILRGDLPDHYLKDNDDMEYYCYQVQIRAFYTNMNGKEEGVCLYRQKDDPDNLIFFTSKEVEDRALGRGVGESLIHPQIWENFLTIHKMNMYEAGAKSALYTDDPSYTSKNKIQDMEQNEITTIEDGKRIYRVPTLDSTQIQLFSNAVNEWYQYAQLAGAAFDPLMGEQPVSGTTFRGQNQVVQQGRGSHDRRRGQRAKFIEKIYRDMIIPQMKKSILNGKKFLAELSLEEMTYVVDSVTQKAFEDWKKELVLNGQDIPDPQTEQLMKDKFKMDFRKKGNKHLLEILKKDFEGVEIRMGISVAGKQKNLAGLSDKLLSIIQFAFTNPQQFQATMQIQGMGKAFSDIMEFSGLNPIDFSTIATMPPQAPQMPQPSPLQVAQPQNG